MKMIFLIDKEIESEWKRLNINHIKTHSFPFCGFVGVNINNNNSYIPSIPPPASVFIYVSMSIFTILFI